MSRPDGTLRSDIAWSTAEEISVRGHDLAGEILGRMSLADFSFLQLTGRVPTPEEGRVYDAILVTLVEHGLTPSALAARLTYLGAPEALQSVADWVLRAFPDARFEGKNLGGQVRFIVPAGSPAGAEGHGGSYAQHLIETLEQHKEDLALQCYSIGAATMERVFLSVVKESDAVEEDEGKRRWRWRV